MARLAGALRSYQGIVWRQTGKAPPERLISTTVGDCRTHAGLAPRAPGSEIDGAGGTEVNGHSVLNVRADPNLSHRNRPNFEPGLEADILTVSCA